MPTYKKLLIFLILFIVVGVVVYKFEKGNTTTNTASKQEEISPKNDVKSLCNEQLENQPDIAVEKFEGTPKPVDFTTLPEAKTFYTMITKAISSGSNFAGHFTLASWGCGTDCFGYAVIDTKTGKIIAYSPANESYHLGDFSLSNGILILEPVYAGQERKYYKVVEAQDGKSKLELTCTEISSKDMYGLPE